MGNNTVFCLQIADRSGAVAQLPAGGALENELTEVLSKAVIEKLVPLIKDELAASNGSAHASVGVWRSKAVLARASEVAVLDMEAKVKAKTEEVVIGALTDTIRAMKLASAKAF